MSAPLSKSPLLRFSINLVLDSKKTTARSMPFKLEAWPGGRWFRDLGNSNT